MIDEKPVLTVMCGLPASGESTYAHKLAKETGAIVFSSDELREEMFGNVNDQQHNHELFIELHRRIKDCLKSGKSAIYDACNINSKRRRAFLQELSNDVFILVNLHMQPYNWEHQSEEIEQKLRGKYRKLWGEEIYQYVIMLHEADKAAH